MRHKEEAIYDKLLKSNVFHGSINSAVASKILATANTGDFLVRYSPERKSYYVTIKMSEGLAHFPLKQQALEILVSKEEKEFKSALNLPGAPVHKAANANMFDHYSLFDRTPQNLSPPRSRQEASSRYENFEASTSRRESTVSPSRENAEPSSQWVRGKSNAFKKHEGLEKSEFFHGTMDDEAAKDKLKNARVNDFIIRYSARENTYCVSEKTSANSIKHTAINNSNIDRLLLYDPSNFKRSLSLKGEPVLNETNTNTRRFRF